MNVNWYMHICVSLYNADRSIPYSYFEFALLLRQAFKRIDKSMDKDVA